MPWKQRLFPICWAMMCRAVQASVTITITKDSPFLYEGLVPSYVVIEYMGQSIAAYSGILARQKEQDVQIVFLLGARKLELKTDCFEIGDEIVIEAEALYNDGEMASFDCMAKDGFEIVIHFGRDEAGAKATLQSIVDEGGAGRLISFDISDRAQCKSVLEADMDAHGAYYGVVLNAGTTSDSLSGHDR